MPNRAGRTEVPNFDTYPAPSPGPEGVPPERQLETELPASNERLNRTAENVGTAVGTAVNAVRDLPDRLQDMKQRLKIVRGAGEPSKADEIKVKAKEKADELKETAGRKIDEARSRATHLANQYPIQVILAAGAIAFAVGLILRLWRSDRGY